MNCQKVRKAIPLAVGGELPEKKCRTMNAHVASCARCQQEWKDYTAALNEIKTLSRTEEIRDWDEAEWKRLMKTIVSERAEKRRTPFGLSPKPALVYGIVSLLLLGGAGLLMKIFVLQPRHFAFHDPNSTQTPVRQTGPAEQQEEVKKVKPLSAPGPQPEKTSGHRSFLASAQKPSASPVGPAPAFPQSRDESGQDILSVTFVSKETGLRIVWLLNKNFEWEEDKK
ncbi:MAG: zf-HC2 domain-containing protein [Candidatus Aminicenantales bacterium]